MVWKGERHRHQMSSKGVRTVINTGKYHKYFGDNVNIATTISKNEYLRLRNKYDTYHKVRKELLGNKNSVSVEEQKLLPESPSTKEIGKIEQYEWVHYPPKKYSLYINEKDRTATTWNGERLGAVRFGAEFRDNFGGTRQDIRVYGNNGVVYYGQYFKSSGDLATIIAYKGQEHIIKDKVD